MLRNVLSGLFAALVPAFPAGAAHDGPPLPPEPHWADVAEMEGYRAALFEDHLACARMAERRLLSFAEVAHCTEVYLALKVSFLHGVTPDRYHQMKPKTRVIANSKGYAAFRAWVHRQSAVND